MNVADNERKVLREPGARIAEIAALPVHEQKAAMWMRLNKLQPERPTVRLNEVCWNEMAVDQELTQHCTEPFRRGTEPHLVGSHTYWPALFMYPHLLPRHTLARPFLKSDAVSNRGLTFSLPVLWM